MKKRLISIFLIILAAVVCLVSCPGILPIYEVSITIVENPDFLDEDNNPLYPLAFSPATDISDFLSGFSDPVVVPELASHAPNNVNATYVTVNAVTNTLFYITGVRMEDIRYSLVPQAGNPIGTSSGITYIHPQLGEISPVIVNLSYPDETVTTGSPGQGIKINPETDNVFEVGLSTMISLWHHIDTDRDDTGFPVDQDEVITLTGKLFFEGYFENGFEFSGGFPNPLQVTMQVYHDTPAS